MNNPAVEIELIQDLSDDDTQAIQDVGNQLVCELPQGFTLTDEKFFVILKAWHQGGKRLIGEDEVAELFTADHQPQ